MPVSKYFLFPVLLITLVFGSATWFYLDGEIKSLHQREDSQVSLYNEIIRHDVQDLLKDLKFLERNTHLQLIINGEHDPSVLHELKHEWMLLSNLRNSYDQIRFIAPDGTEMVRVNNNGDSNAYIVPDPELQNKSTRPYFAHALNLAEQDIYLSPLDLNIENGEIEKPFKAMIRASKAVYDKTGKVAGVVVINFRAIDFLEKLRQMGGNGISEAMLLNQDGYWLLANDREKEWGFQLGHGQSFPVVFSDVWERMLPAEKGYYENAAGCFSFMKVFPLEDFQPGFDGGRISFDTNSASYHWIIISFISAEKSRAFINDKLRLPVVLYVVSLLVVLIGGMITFRQYGMRQDTEEKLLESRRLLRTVFDTIPHALFAKNREQRYIMVNEALSEMFKVRPQDCIGRTINDFKAIGEEAKQQINSRDNQVIQEGRPVLETIRMRFEDGKESFREIIKLPLFDEKHKIIGMVGVSQDVTERHIAETMLRKSEQRYRTLIEGTIQGIIILQQKRPVFANNAAAGLFRFADCEDLLRLDSLEPLLSADDYPVLWQAWEKNQAEKPGEPLLVNIRCRCHDNSEIRVEAFLSEVVWEDAPAVMIALMDVTERDQLEEKLRQSQKMEAVGQLAGGIAHDINNTFQVIMLNTEAMLETEKSERTREKLESIQRSISTSSSTISQLLTFGKLDNLVRKNLKINDLIRHSTNLLKRLIGENIELALNLDPQAGYVNVDPGMIQQVILNLCINSRDAMPNGGRLEISSQFFVTDESFLKTHQDIQAGEYALVRVSDSGHGMSEEVLQKVFEPFFSTKPVGKGTGLGLSMVHGIIRQHGGYIDLQSAVGGGTTVSIYLSASAEQPRKEMQAPKARHVEGKGKTILIAEDEKELLDNLQEMLLLKGFCVIAANNGEEALEMLNAEQDIDMAILDMIMPKVSGQMLYEQIRKTHPRLPVLFTTGYSTVNFKDFVREDGLVRMIQKPYNSNDLFENISNLCS